MAAALYFSNSCRQLLCPQPFHLPFLHTSNRNHCTLHNRHCKPHPKIYHIPFVGFGNATLNIDVYKDYYKALGVDKKASKKEIRASYLKLAKKWHPDVHKKDADKESAESKFMSVDQLGSDCQIRFEFQFVDGRSQYTEQHRKHTRYCTMIPNGGNMMK